ncbi:MAG: DMT family transporter [Methanocorpusculum sp.]|nr:DMT family transporter [Methanocorpusculum sp.]
MTESIKSGYKGAVFCAILAAALFALSTPFSKLFLNDVPPMMMAAFLYLGAGIGMIFIWILKKVFRTQTKEMHLSKKDMPYVLAMIFLDIAAPISLMLGLTMTTASNASLLNNFEIVATSVIALMIFKEVISKRLWFAILLVTAASILLSVEDFSTITFSVGSFFVIAACIFWGFENNCTKMISGKDPLEIVLIKGIFSGLGALAIALFAGEAMPQLIFCILVLILGFVSYGLSIFFYVYAQRSLGAAKTSTYYAVAPFLGVGFSLIIFRELPSLVFIIALVIMTAGVYFASSGVKQAEK